MRTVKILLWLDDVRDPYFDDWLIFSPIGRSCKVVWVKSYNEFVEYINNSLTKNRYEEDSFPDGICFDHDLGDEHDNEKTGYDCAKYLVEFIENNNIIDRFPKFSSQSANPIGRVNILTYLQNAIKHLDKN